MIIENIEDIPEFIAKLRAKGWYELVPTENAWVFQKANHYANMVCYVVWEGACALFIHVRTNRLYGG